MMPEYMLDEASIRAALWAYSLEGGIEPGGFFTLIVRAFQHADLENFARLATGFPELGAWMHVLKTHPDGVELAQRALVQIGARS